MDSPSNQLDPNTLWKETETRKNNKESETGNIFFHKRGRPPVHMGLFVSFWREREPIHVQISLVTTRNELIRLLAVVSAQSNKGGRYLISQEGCVSHRLRHYLQSLFSFHPLCPLGELARARRLSSKNSTALSVRHRTTRSIISGHCIDQGRNFVTLSD